MRRVADALDLYEESYSVVLSACGQAEASSPAVEAWYEEAKRTKGWNLYASPEGEDDRETDLDDGIDGRTTEVEDDPPPEP
jgi:hypothetical protein